jgi:hypothetical protein
MQKMLPEHVEAARTSSNSRSVTDALHFIEDSLECFHLYQGHCMRVCNQQDAIQVEEDDKIREDKRRVLRNKRGQYNMHNHNRLEDEV